MEKYIDINMLKCFENKLWEDEKSYNTIEKYMRDIRYFVRFLNGRSVDKALTLEYKSMLLENFAIASANSMIAAVNSFFRFAGWLDCCVKQFKIQKQIYYPEEKELSKEEYIRLVNTAMKKGNERLCLILQTICGTGIRVSELQYVTVEAARKGKVEVNCKGKTRTVFIVKQLRDKLLKYAKSKKITEGIIFITKNGKPISRTSIWRDMKSLCRQADVSPEKVFPHNLRHLFARTFYGIEKDIAKLADILGHSSINTTRIYIITTGIEHRRMMENMKLIV